MKKVWRFNFFAFVFAAMALVACDNNEQISKPINSDGTSKVADADMSGDDASIAEAKRKRQELADQREREKQESRSAQLPATKMEFREYDWDFGTIDEGDNVEHMFSFTNTGTEPLILENCKGSCGCTVPQCPKQPIPPGGTGEIKVVFNSKGKKNMQTKTVTITANTEPLDTKLTIRANVTPEG